MITVRSTPRSRRVWVAALLCTAAALGCQAATEPADESAGAMSVPEGWTRDVGALFDVPDSSAALSLPRRARVGRPLTITVTTGGSGSCTRPSGASVEIDRLTATVVPLDAHPGSAIACSRDLRPYPRSVELTFHQAGVAHVVVTGVRLGAPGGMISVARSIVVLP